MFQKQVIVLEFIDSAWFLKQTFLLTLQTQKEMFLALEEGKLTT